MDPEPYLRRDITHLRAEMEQPRDDEAQLNPSEQIAHDWIVNRMRLPDGTALSRRLERAAVATQLAGHIENLRIAQQLSSQTEQKL